MSKVLSLDPASLKNLGVCISNITKRKMSIVESFTKVFEVELENKDKRLLDTKILMEEILEKHNIEIVVFERSMGFGKAFIRNQLSEQTGIVKLMSYEHEIPVVEISPKTAKKIITGNGNAKKKEVIENVLRVFDLQKKDMSSEHEADAISMAYAYFKMEK